MEQNQLLLTKSAFANGSAHCSKTLQVLNGASDYTNKTGYIGQNP
jgi:hypothetical protein